MLYFYGAHVVCIYFVIGFYHLVERCYCILSEWLFHPVAPQTLVVSFHGRWIFRGIFTNLPRKSFFSRCLLLYFYVKFNFFTYGHASLQQITRQTLCLYISDSPPPPPPSLLNSKPVIMLDALRVMLRLVMGQLKDKLLLNKSMTLLRTNRAVERV